MTIKKRLDKLEKNKPPERVQTMTDGERMERLKELSLKFAREAREGRITVEDYPALARVLAIAKVFENRDLRGET